MIYFDHNAATPIDERVLEAMLPYLQQLYGNPSSLCRLGRIARSAVDTAREQVAASVDASADQVVFTSGGTEADVLALSAARGKRLWISAIEHPAVFENALDVRYRFTAVRKIAVKPAGTVSLEHFNELPLQAGDLVSVMLANNETGAVQPVAEIAQATKARGALLHSDAVQAVGKLAVGFKNLGVDLLSLSSHKIYGPKGAGALIRRTDIDLLPLQRGGDQEFGLRAGTENVAAIVGFGKAAELARIELAQRTQYLKSLRDRLESQLKAIPGLVIFAEHAPRLVNTVQFGLAGVDGAMLLMQLDRKGIAVSSGSACKAGSTEISPVLEAMGVEMTQAKSAVRVSLGKDNTEQQVDHFVGVVKTLLDRG